MSKSSPGTVKRSELASFRMTAGNEKRYSRVILDGHVQNWVGIGWVDEGKATKADLQRYPTVVD